MAEPRRLTKPYPVSDPSTWRTVRKFIHKNDGNLYTSQGVAIPLKSEYLSEDTTILGVKVSDLEGMIYYSGGQ